MKEPKWQKLGLIYQASRLHDKLITHASNPLAMHLQQDQFRIFYSGRDSINRSSVSYIDYDLDKNEILCIYDKPIVTPEDNTFYSHGITIGNYWNKDGQTYLGFMGWQQKEGQHWRGDIGCFSLDTKEINLLMGTSEEDRVSLSYPNVFYEDGLYKMWYGSTVDWQSRNGEMIHVNKYATSKNLKDWNHYGLAVPFELGVAQAFSKPSIIKHDGTYHMWMSYRGGNGIPYRVGYSQSKDGITWNFKQSNLDVSDDGWDSEMVCYPYVFKHNDSIYMLYNGNRYGLSGFGIARAEF